MPRRSVGLYVAIGLGALVVLGAVGFVGSRFLTRFRAPTSVAAVDAVDQATPRSPVAEPRAAAGTDAAPSTAAPAGADASAAPVAAAGADGAAPAAVARAPAEPAAAAAAGAPLDAGAATATAKPAAEPAPAAGKPAAEPAPAAGKPAAAPAAETKPADAALSAAAKRKLKQKEREALLRQGYELIAKNQQPLARETLNKALKLGDDPGVRELLAMSHRRSGELLPAAGHLEKAAAASSGVSRARRYVAVGDLYLQLGKKADACKAYRSAASAVPSFEPAQKQLASRCGGKN